MLSRIHFLWLLAITITLNACGEFTYKRGANVAQLEDARRMCQSKSSDDAIEKCMQDGGWTIQKLDSFEIFTQIDQDPDEQITEQIPNADIKKNVSADEKTTTQLKTVTKPIESGKTIKPSKRTVATNPLDTFVVPTWWKTGVKPDSFQIDSDACVEKLGEAYKPDGKTQTVTFGFISCMGEKGWKAFKKTK